MYNQRPSKSSFWHHDKTTLQRIWDTIYPNEVLLMIYQLEWHLTMN